MGDGKFVTAINCMDGRTQLPVIRYLRKRCGADYVDMITEPGPTFLIPPTRPAVFRLVHPFVYPR